MPGPLTLGPVTPPSSWYDESKKVLEDSYRTFSESPEAKYIVGTPPNPTQEQPAEGDVPELPVIDGTSESGLDSSSGTGLGIGARQFVFPRLPVSGIGKPQGVAVPSYYNYNVLDDEDGKALFQDTYQTIPKRMAETSQNIGTLEGGKAEDTADWLKSEQTRQAEEHAALVERRMQREQEYLARQQKMDTAVQRYSNDLADRGQYWRSPGSMISAFGAALVAMGSPGDPGIGLRMIQQQVDADFAKRKAAADMHLGELRSDLHNYRQFMGDSNAGDTLAYAESHRIAALELQRIANQYQGPLAREKAKLMADQLLEQSNGLRMRAYAMGIYNKPSIQDPRIAREIVAEGNANPGVGPTPFKGSWNPEKSALPNNGKPAPWLAEQMGDKTVSSGQGQSSVTTSTSSREDSIIKSLMPPMDEKFRSDVDKRAPGASAQLESERMDVARRIWSVSHGNPNVFNEKMEAFERNLENDIKEVSKAAQPALSKINGYRRMQTDMAILDKAAQRLNVPVESLVGTTADTFFGTANMAKYDDMVDALTRADPANANKYQREKQEMKDAVSRFKQLVAGQTNAYIKDTSGSAVSALEDDRLKSYLGRGWRGMKVFVEDGSRRSQADLSGAINTASHPVSGTLWRIQYGLGTGRLDVGGIGSHDEANGEAMQKGLDNKLDERQRTINKAIENARRAR